MTQCPPPSEPASNAADDVALALKQVYDEYGVCAGRHTELIEVIHKNQARAGPESPSGEEP